MKLNLRYLLTDKPLRMNAKEFNNHTGLGAYFAKASNKAKEVKATKLYKQELELDRVKILEMPVIKEIGLFTFDSLPYNDEELDEYDLEDEFLEKYRLYKEGKN